MLAHEVSTKEWCPAIYARLSDEDKENKSNGVSLSIDHQIEILQGFIKDKGWQSAKVFYDDDRTGTNFDRQGFQDMYAAAQKGSVNVIVIKDTSRFGRNWVKSGDYFERIAEMGVRFISIQEGIDTIDPQCPALKMLPFYFIFNEWHSQTTSEKIKAVFHKQMEQGKFHHHFVPYGYAKDPNDKYKLVIDPVTAPVVKRIFAMRLQKYSYGAIARVLNEEGIISPGGYKVQNAETKAKYKLCKWSSDNVRGLMQNPVYCGDVVQNKFGSVSYKNQKSVKKSPEEWIIVKDMHEPIVSHEDFQKCVELRETLGRVRQSRNAHMSPFTGLLVCPDCGYKMNRTTSYYTVKSTGENKFLVGYTCSAFMKMGKDACCSHYITESDLTKVLISDIRALAGEVMQDENAARERFYAIKEKSSGTKLNADKSALKKVNKRLAELDKLLQAAFEKSVLGGAVSELFTEYARKYETEKQELMKQANQLSASIEKQSQTESDVETFIALLKKYVDITDLDRATAVELVDHITVSASAVTPREIVIYYNRIGKVE